MTIDCWSRVRALVCAALLLAPLASAQDFPARQPVKLIVTFAPGGGSDTIARTLNAWVGTFVPRATPADVVDKLHQATLAAPKDPAVAARMESQAGFIIAGSPAELDALVSREIIQFTQVVREQGLKPE